MGAERPGNGLSQGTAVYSGITAGKVRLFRAAAVEARAIVRLLTLLPRDIGTTIPLAIRDGDDVVVLVHGSLATGGAFRPLRRRLEARKKHVVTFTYGPASGVKDIAAAIAAAMAAVPPGARVHLVGHSLGGLAVRWYVQELPPDARIVQTISVAAPFGGARAAFLLPGPAGRDLRRRSEVLARLAASAHSSAVPHLSILGAADTAVPADTVFPVGERFVVPDAGHNALLFHEAVQARIVAEI